MDFFVKQKGEIGSTINGLSAQIDDDGTLIIHQRDSSVAAAFTRGEWLSVYSMIEREIIEAHFSQDKSVPRYSGKR